jgi:hypothetical protein
MFDADGFVIAASSNVVVNGENGTDFKEKAFESAAVINHNQATETDFQKDILDKEASKVMGSDIVGGSDHDKAGEVAHDVHEVGFAAIVFEFTGGPQIDVQNIEWAAEGPRENELAVTGDGPVGGKAVGALEAPVSNIFAAMGPEEPEADAMECLVDSHVTGGGGGMVSGENVTAKRKGNNDQHQKFGVILDRLVDDQFAVDQGRAVLANVVAVGGVEGSNVRFGKGFASG